MSKEGFNSQYVPAVNKQEQGSSVSKTMDSFMGGRSILIPDVS